MSDLLSHMGTKNKGTPIGPYRYSNFLLTWPGWSIIKMINAANDPSLAESKQETKLQVNNS